MSDITGEPIDYVKLLASVREFGARIDTKTDIERVCDAVQEKRPKIMQALREAERGEPQLSETSGQLPRQVPASELRAVAAEFRAIADDTELCSRTGVRNTGASEFRAWADRLDPPEPEPLKVGDRVRITAVGGKVPLGYQALKVERIP